LTYCAERSLRRASRLRRTRQKLANKVVSTEAYAELAKQVATVVTYFANFAPRATEISFHLSLINNIPSMGVE